MENEETTQDSQDPRKEIHSSAEGSPSPAKPFVVLAPYPQGSVAQNYVDNLISSTNTTLTGTISSLSALESIMRRATDEQFERLQPNVDNRIAEFIEPFKAQLDFTTKQIQEAKNSLSVFRDFVKENENAFIDLIAARGKMSALESQMTSVLTRLEKLEGDKNFSWNKSATIAAIILSFVSLCCALFVGLAEVYSAFFK